MMDYGLWNPDLGQEAKNPQQAPLPDVSSGGGVSDQ